jgi:hydroxymethylglutaryl-CoA lyase
VAARARVAGVALRGTIACSFVSPWAEEIVEDGRVVAIARHYERGGCTSVGLADTVGRADPRTVAARLRAVRAGVEIPLAVHLHDASGYGLANVYAALEAGVRRFEGALAGLGGCPFAPDAPGNLNLLRLGRFIEDCGFATGVDFERLAGVERRITSAVAGARELAPAGR